MYLNVKFIFLVKYNLLVLIQTSKVNVFIKYLCYSCFRFHLLIKLRKKTNTFFHKFMNVALNQTKRMQYTYIFTPLIFFISFDPSYF